MKAIINCCIAITLITFALFVGGSTEVQAATCTVTNLNDSGPGSLRAAIACANTNPGPDTIVFSVAGTINVSSQLPELSDTTGGTTIDGTTAPGYSGAPVVALQGPGSSSFSGLRITSANNEVRVLQIGGFNYGIEIDGSSASSNAIVGSYVGTDGEVALPNGTGIRIWGAPNNRIGTNGDGVDDTMERNVISGNSGTGVYVALNAATGNLVKGNFIGTNVTGTAALGNYTGVSIASAIGNIIGGTTASERNVISGSGSAGVQIAGRTSADNLVQGNFIGTDVTGTTRLGNFKGVWIYSASNNTVGGTTSGARNIISGNNKHGVNIGDSPASGNLVQGNLIGTDVTGTADLGNTSDGVHIYLAANNMIGGTTPGARNIISANSNGVVIRDSGAPGNLVQGNFIGTDVTGTSALGNHSNGVSINNSSFNTIGGTDTDAGNIIAFNNTVTGHGVYVQSGTGNAILSNSVHSNGGLGIDLYPYGVTPNDLDDGDTGANNLQNFPVLTSATNSGGSTTIEGTLNSTANTTFTLEFFSNTATDPSGYGEGQTFLGSTTVTTDGSGNASFVVTFPTQVPSGQFVTATATDPAGNTSEFSEAIPVGCSLTVTNLNDSGPGSLREAVNCANTNAGPDTIDFAVAGTINVTSQLPTLSDTSGGTTIDGTTAPGYSGTPAVILNGPGASGTESGLRITSADNEVRALQIDSFGTGIEIFGISASGNVIVGNYIGTNGTAAVPNDTGITIENAPNNTIGGTATAARNVISGNNQDGVYLYDNGATGNLVLGNFIGIDVNGTNTLGNSRYGVYIFHAPGNTIGGTTAGAGNIISSNSSGGISITGSGATGNLVQGNFIGTDVNGTSALGNSRRGVVISYASSNIIGGTTAEARNIISSNSSEGIYINGSGATGNLVQGNFIGTDVTGTVALGNSSHGVIIGSAPGNTIGGTTTGARNIISSNSSSGIYITGSGATGNLVQGNFIGTDVNGTSALGNSYDGVVISKASSNIIGGATAEARNIISGNNPDGVRITGSGATGNLVQGNFIGTDVTGTAALGNTSSGVSIIGGASNNIIGGADPGAGNIIAFNGDDGVAGVAKDGINNGILSNSIFSNTGLGIDLNYDGVTPNDSGDGDTGANNLQNFPVLTSATSDAMSTTIEGALNSTLNTDFTLEFFSNTACDPSGFGEGETFLGSDTVTTDSSGNVSFTVTLPTPVPLGEFITATATDPNNNTSEFSKCGVDVEPPNQPPVATDDSDSTAEDTPVNIDVLANDTDPDGDTLTIDSVTQGSNGSVTNNGNDVTYTPAADFCGNDSFTYTVSDGNGGTDTATVDVTITCVNDAPVAVDDAYSVDEDNTLNVVASGVLGNDSDVEGDALTAVLVSNVTNGTLALNADGSFTYTPDANFNDTDSFTYKANDGATDSNIATVTITVNPVNDPPVAADDAYGVDEDGMLDVAAPGGVLGNDTDADGDPLTAILVSDASHGTLTFNADGSFTYTPDANFHGTDTFTYKANDGATDSNIATVTIAVNSVNDAPVAVDDTATTDEDTSVDIDVLANDSDVDADTLTVESVTQPASGSVTNNGTDVTYTPNADFCGSDSFTYTVSDGHGGTDTATVTVTVNPVNDAPVAEDDTAETDENVPVDIDVLANDRDMDDDTLTVISVTDGANGTVTILDGSVRYSPNVGFDGEDSFTYTISDGNGGTATATVAVTVIPANKPPTASAGGPYGGDEGSAIVLSGASASDPDNDPLTISWSVDSALCSFDDATALKPTLTCDDNGSYIVTLTVDDGVNDPVSSDASVTVNNVAPTASFNAPVDVNEGSDINLSLTDSFDPSSADTSAGFEYAFDCGDGAGYSTFGTSNSAVCPTDDNGIRAVGAQIRDKDGGVTEYTASVTVNNVAPTIETISVPLEPVNINDQSSFSVDVTFSDPAWANDEPYTCAFDFDNDGVDDTTVGGVIGTSCNAALSYAEPGVYTVRVTVTDKDGSSDSATATEFIVIYDPEGGFVTGGGWINSPPGACRFDACTDDTTGKANFGFVSKYKKGADVPTGETEFQFKAGNLNFHSDSYEWLVVANHKAMYKGVGTINGAGNYGFMLSAIDEKLTPSTDVDLFRIKIWDKDDGGTIVYDNQMGAEDDADPITAIGGGNIVIHK